MTQAILLATSNFLSLHLNRVSMVIYRKAFSYSFFLSSFFSLAQTLSHITFHGEAVPFVSAYLGCGTWGYIDVDGAFAYRYSCRTIRRKVSAVGFISQSNAVSVSGGTTHIDFELKEDVFNLTCCSYWLAKCRRKA